MPLSTILDETESLIPQHLWESVLPLDVDEGHDFVYAEDNNGNYMIRNTKRKLLLCKSKKSQFFDLEKDPYELNNVINEPAYAGDLKEFKNQLLHWALFESRTTIHLDEMGPTSSPGNARCFEDGHRNEMIEYFRNKMKIFLERKKSEE